MSEKSARRNLESEPQQGASVSAEPGETAEAGDRDEVDVSVDVRDGDDDSGAEGSAESDEPATVTLSADEHARLVQERQAYLDELRRTRADFENYQKRVRRERPSWEAQALRGFIRDFLSVVDNFERAIEMTEGSTLESFSEGIRMIYQMLLTTLEEHGVKAVDALGQPFDPNYHEALSQMETDDPTQDGRVIDVHEKGYLHDDAVIRAARVVVGRLRPRAPDTLEEAESPENSAGNASPGAPEGASESDAEGNGRE